MISARTRRHSSGNETLRSLEGPVSGGEPVAGNDRNGREVDIHLACFL